MQVHFTVQIGPPIGSIGCMSVGLPFPILIINHGNERRH